MWNERDIAYETFDTMHLDAWQRINHFRNGREVRVHVARLVRVGGCWQLLSTWLLPQCAPILAL